MSNETSGGVEVLDCLGLKCPRPMLKVIAKAPSIKPGTVLEIHGDCATIENDIRAYCEQMHKVLLSVKSGEGDKKIIQVQF